MNIKHKVIKMKNQNNQNFQHHIHIRLGEEIHTIACKGNFIEFSDLSKLLDQILSDYQHKALHNV